MEARIFTKNVYGAGNVKKEKERQNSFQVDAFFALGSRWVC